MNDSTSSTVRNQFCAAVDVAVCLMPYYAIFPMIYTEQKTHNCNGMLLLWWTIVCRTEIIFARSRLSPERRIGMDRSIVVVANFVTVASERPENGQSLHGACESVNKEPYFVV